MLDADSLGYHLNEIIVYSTSPDAAQPHVPRHRLGTTHARTPTTSSPNTTPPSSPDMAPNTRHRVHHAGTDDFFDVSALQPMDDEEEFGEGTYVAEDPEPVDTAELRHTPGNLKPSRTSGKPALTRAKPPPGPLASTDGRRARWSKGAARPQREWPLSALTRRSGAGWRSTCRQTSSHAAAKSRANALLIVGRAVADLGPMVGLGPSGSDELRSHGSSADPLRFARPRRVG
jgi:hypothetical protein